MHERHAWRSAGRGFPGPLDTGLGGTGLVADDLWLLGHDDRSGKPPSYRCCEPGDSASERELVVPGRGEVAVHRVGHVDAKLAVDVDRAVRHRGIARGQPATQIG